ncbi:polycystic kidney disease protein 1-like 2 [Danio aesculapii]|uniref:polycystic kidney disease protein 1-like 2 n=1 Tax=Danio aesculapii TaxID=1142201 RepID=UPI0024C0D200|nr:polycystic kidney disease protein 1-like 2 [Danio aesculapii]
MDSRLFTLVFLVGILALSEGFSCSENQQSFESSCFEFVDLQLSFLNAQAWCEQDGGHLAFIQNDETQQFLQKHLQNEREWWIGLVSTSDNRMLDTQEDGLVWLDGSDVIYSNWFSGSRFNTGCGFIHTDSGFLWKTTSNCSQELPFICEFELGYYLSCVDSTTLQCSSAQVIEVEASYFGRRTPHYCRRAIPNSVTDSLEQCGWISVLDTVAELCDGHQVCTADVSSFREPCPVLGSYLLVEYNCKDRSPHVIKERAVFPFFAKKPSKTPAVNWICYSSSDYKDSLTVTCSSCGATDNHDTIQLHLQNATCDDISWYVQDGGKSKQSNKDSSKKNCLQKHNKVLNPHNGNNADLDVNANSIRPLKMDLLVLVSCKKGSTISYGTFTIQYSLIKMSNDEVKSAVKAQLSQIGTPLDTEQFKEDLLLQISSLLEDSEPLQPSDVLSYANDLVNIIKDEGKMTVTAQEYAGQILSVIGSSLTSIDLTPGNISALAGTATLIVQSSSHLLGAFDRDKESDITNYLLSAVDSVHTFLLANKIPDQEPAVISTTNLNIYANRLSPHNLQKEPFTVVNSSASFKLPNLGSDILPVGEPVDVKMAHYNIDPWAEGHPISSIVASMSLSKTNGSGIPVANLTEEIEIFLPRLNASTVDTSDLDLGHYSTTVINITTPNITLVIKLSPSEDLTLLVLLGYQSQPTEGNNKATVTLPQQGNSQDERYTWVLGPDDLALDVGVYNLLIRPKVPPGVKSINASVTVTSVTAQCIFWEQARANWSDHGCRVGPKTTPYVTQCLCTHLTFFGNSFFVMPNTVDPTKSAQLFSNFAQNPVVVCFIGAIFVAFILTAAWARRKDLKDKAKVKVTVLDDNDPFAEYCYLLKISTGHRPGSSTSSRVIVTVQGTEGDCEPHHLTDQDKPVFERGGVDLFLLTTPFSLGDLQSIRLWHDNSGNHPAWFVSTVVIKDLQTEQKWNFLCNSWLSVDVDDCTVEKVFPVASEVDMKGFSNVFFSKTTTDFCDKHLWYSVVCRPVNSSFTCVQRVSCCFSVLLCSMLTSIMFYGIPTDPSEQTMEMGQIQLTWSQVMIGFESTLIVFPINLIIVGIFRRTRPRKKMTKKQKPQKKSEPPQTENDIQNEFDQNNLTEDFLIKDIQRITYLFAHAMRCPLPKTETISHKSDINALLSELQILIEQQHLIHKNKPSSIFPAYTHHLTKQLKNMEGEVKLLGPSGFSRPGCFIQVLLQVQDMLKLLESLVSSLPFTEQQTCNSKPKKHGCQKGPPWWFVYVGWILVIGTSVISGYFTMLYGLKYGKDRSVSWIISNVTGFTQSLCFTEPVKVVFLGIFFALVMKKVEAEDEEVHTLQKKTTTGSDGLSGVCFAQRDCTQSYYQPPPPGDIEKIRRNMLKQQKAQALVMEILIFLGFLSMLLLVAYGQQDQNAFYLTQHIQQSFSNGISDSMKTNDVFVWANTVLLNNLFGQYPGFITDGNSKLVGSAHLRQVRVKKDSCKVAKAMLHTVSHCNTPYSWGNEDMASYNPGWVEFNSVNDSEEGITAWQYQSQSTLKSLPVWGVAALYRGGGYVMDLGSDLQNATMKLQYLFNSTWLDEYTRAVFVEFTVYNANVNLFCIVTLILESSAVGAFQFRSVLQNVSLYNSVGSFISFLMASRVIYFLFVVYYMFLQGKLLKRQKWAYFRNKWNLLDMAIIILSWSSLSLFIQKTVQGNIDIQYYQKHKNQFPSFHDTAAVDATLRYVMAFLVLLGCVKLWHLLRLSPKLYVIASSLQRAWDDMSTLTVVIFIILLAYSLACNLIFGWELYSYRTLPDAFTAIFSLQIGIFNYDEVLNSNPALGAVIISSCVLIATFVVLSLFISIILMAVTEERENHQPSEEEETVELVMMKIMSFFGIKSKKKEETHNPSH